MIYERTEVPEKTYWFLGTPAPCYTDFLGGNSDELTGVRVNSLTLWGFPLSPFVYTHLCNTSILLSFLAIVPLTSHPSISIKRKPFTWADRSIGRNLLLRARERYGGGRGIHGYLLFPDSALVSRWGVLDPLDRIELECKGHPEHLCRGTSFCEQRQKPEIRAPSRKQAEPPTMFPHEGI